MRPGTRYDGLADWYNAVVSGQAAHVTALAQETLLALVGEGPWRCLDLCCGGGVNIPALLERAW